MCEVPFITRNSVRLIVYLVLRFWLEIAIGQCTLDRHRFNEIHIINLCNYCFSIHCICCLSSTCHISSSIIVLIKFSFCSFSYKVLYYSFCYRHITMVECLWFNIYGLLLIIKMFMYSMRTYFSVFSSIKSYILIACEYGVIFFFLLRSTLGNYTEISCIPYKFLVNELANLSLLR